MLVFASIISLLLALGTMLNLIVLQSLGIESSGIYVLLFVFAVYAILPVLAVRAHLLDKASAWDSRKLHLYGPLLSGTVMALLTLGGLHLSRELHRWVSMGDSILLSGLVCWALCSSCLFLFFCFFRGDGISPTAPPKKPDLEGGGMTNIFRGTSNGARSAESVEVPTRLRRIEWIGWIIVLSSTFGVTLTLADKIEVFWRRLASPTIEIITIDQPTGISRDHTHPVPMNQGTVIDITADIRAPDTAPWSGAYIYGLARINNHRSTPMTLREITMNIRFHGDSSEYRSSSGYICKISGSEVNLDEMRSVYFQPYSATVVQVLFEYFPPASNQFPARQPESCSISFVDQDGREYTSLPTSLPSGSL